MRARHWGLGLSLLLGPFSTLAGCAREPAHVCFEAAQRSPLLKAPRNGGQLGGMTIEPGGVTAGSGAPNLAADLGHGLLRIYVVLSSPGAGLTDTQKSALSSALSDCKKGGVQAFVRFYYEDALTSKANAASVVSKIESDIASAKALIGQYLDIVPFLQAGFLGPWGEWWGGDLEGADFGTDQNLRALKTGVVNALKSAFPNTFIQLRYPRDIATYYADDPQIAFHDDSVLAGDDDGGTFNATKKCGLWPDGDPGKQRAWIKQRSLELSSVNAGESSENTADVSCDALLAYLKEYRIFVFNTQWPAVVTKCEARLKSELGWSGPLSPTGSTGSGGATSSGGASSSGGVGFGTELGCWSTDQRPWQLCKPEGCAADRCRRTAGDAECSMYRASACKGSWPPTGYPGEETLPTGAGGGNNSGTGGTGANGSDGGSGSVVGAAAGSGSTATGGAAPGGNSSVVGGSGPSAGTSPAGVTNEGISPSPDGGC